MTKAARAAEVPTRATEAPARAVEAPVRAAEPARVVESARAVEVVGGAAAAVAAVPMTSAGTSMKRKRAFSSLR
jgi:hypothetical protein